MSSKNIVKNKQLEERKPKELKTQYVKDGSIDYIFSLHYILLSMPYFFLKYLTSDYHLPQNHYYGKEKKGIITLSFLYMYNNKAFQKCLGHHTLYK